MDTVCICCSRRLPCTLQSETATGTGENPPPTQCCLVICLYICFPRNLPISFLGNKVNDVLSPFVTAYKLASSSKDPLFGQELASSLGHDPAITFETYKSTWAQTWWLRRGRPKKGVKTCTRMSMSMAFSRRDLHAVLQASWWLHDVNASPNIFFFFGPSPSDWSQELCGEESLATCQHVKPAIWHCSVTLF